MKRLARWNLLAAALVGSALTVSAQSSMFGTIRYYPIRYSSSEEAKSTATENESSATAKPREPAPEIVANVDPAAATPAHIKAWILQLTALKADARAQAQANLIAVNEQAVEQLVRRLQVASTTERSTILSLLNEMKVPLADEALAEVAVCDHRNAVSTQAIKYLRERQSAAGRRRLLDLVMTPDRELRRTSALAIRLFGDKQCVGELIKELEKQVLGSVQPEKAVPAAKATPPPPAVPDTKAPGAKIPEVKKPEAAPAAAPVAEKKAAEAPKAAAGGTPTPATPAPMAPGSRGAVAPAALALNAVTGEAFGENVKKWKTWWEANRERYVFPAKQIR